MRGCLRTSRPATCSRLPRRVPTVGRWRATTTRCSSHPSSPSPVARAASSSGARRSTTCSRWTKDEGGEAVVIWAVGGAVDVRPLRVAMLGCGVVGSEVVRLLQAHERDLAQRVGAPLELAGIAVRRPTRARGLPVYAALFSSDAAELAARPDIDIVVEVIGGIEPARSLLLSALERGASVDR